MNLSTFDFRYPPELVAQIPEDSRDHARFLIADRRAKTIQHALFYQIVDFLEPGDCLVLNDTKVIPARFYGKKDSGGRVELVLLREVKEDIWRCLGYASKKLKLKDKITIAEDLTAEIIEIEKEGTFIAQFFSGAFPRQDLWAYGHMPLPPYIDRPSQPPDKERYQTVYAKNSGAVAAPTAGLHWSTALMRKAKDKGVEMAMLTLHVGHGTFQPIREQVIEDHKMHAEYFNMDDSAAGKINGARRVIAVGTTTARALESSVRDGRVIAQSGWTELYMYPGYDFKVVDALQTNFHQPKSSLLVMVSAFAETNFIRQCYEEAIRRRYRLFSYGDTMLIL